MKDSNKYGFVVMAIWIVFVIILISGYAAYNHSTFSEYFIDKETNGIISTCFFAAWASIWFAIGSHCRKRYTTMCEKYLMDNPDVEQSTVRHIIKVYYSAKTAKLLTVVLVAAVPGWWIVKLILNTASRPVVKDYVITFTLIILSIACYWYYRKNRNLCA